MFFRKDLEELEETLLSPHATRSKNSRGRERFEEPCDVRTAFQRDRDRIVHSKSFRRLKHKTQVFIAPEGDHYRTRLTHTIEVSQVARTAARALRLNEDLTEAIALGHDLGHTPFGHAGEETLNELFPGGFKHNEQSLRVVDYLEGNGGLNLTWEVRDGILHHTGPGIPATPEGQLVRICDRMAYINHDIDDALRGGIIRPGQLPPEETAYLGATGSERLNTMIRDLINNSWGKQQIAVSKELAAVMESLRKFLYDNVYIGSTAKLEERKTKIIIKMLYNYWTEKPQELPPEVREQSFKYGLERSICDYIAGMTDQYIITVFRELFVPQPWKS
ncbi:MAG TPA: deoxyguanosinetriphosphate triphosphohydrolase [Firmicutes bacterium]|nr:deoxyguanosinetriphosphate triphosphohydrolase [Bacillota bacterium]HAA34446.1 deoxyguanosinetriphosphate triphosphohydrolase [Bacillota bacterium]